MFVHIFLSKFSNNRHRHHFQSWFRSFFSLLVRMEIIGVRVSGFEAGLAVFMCTHHVVPTSFVFLLSFFSVSSLLLCAPLGAFLLPLHLCLLRHRSLGSSSSLLSELFIFCFFCLRACQVEMTALVEASCQARTLACDCLNVVEPGWATTSCCDIGITNRSDFSTSCSRPPYDHGTAHVTNLNCAWLTHRSYYEKLWLGVIDRVGE